jgi:hypothetical protein
MILIGVDNSKTQMDLNIISNFMDDSKQVFRNVDTLQKKVRGFTDDVH